MAKNKIIFDGEVLIDLTQDSITKSKVLAGTTFHDNKGESVVGECTFDADTKDATATEDDILLGKTAYKNGIKLTGNMPNNGQQDSAITTLNQSVTIAYGFHDGSGKVQIDNTEKTKIKAENIRNGVTILGIKGTLMEGGSENPEPKRTVVPTTSKQSITPAAGYTCLREVEVSPIPYKETANATGTTVTIG